MLKLKGGLMNSSSEPKREPHASTAGLAPAYLVTGAVLMLKLKGGLMIQLIIVFSKDLLDHILFYSYLGTRASDLQNVVFYSTLCHP